jgi:hypothetical protein
MRLHLNGDLCGEPYSALNRAPFRKPLEKSNPALFR